MVSDGLVHAYENPVLYDFQCSPAIVVSDERRDSNPVAMGKTVIDFTQQVDLAVQVRGIPTFFYEHAQGLRFHGF
jgi:hypothetical protein